MIRYCMTESSHGIYFNWQDAFQLVGRISTAALESPHSAQRNGIIRKGTFQKQLTWYHLVTFT